MGLEPAHDGEPCEPTEEELACNIQSCNGDCVLSEWTEWAGCSKACDTGSQRRTKSVDKEAHGSGLCWDATSEERLEFKDCNTFPCEDILPENRTTLHCNSRQDVII